MTRKQNPMPRSGAKRKANATSPDLRILFTCVGRRIELLEAFRRAARKLRIKLEIHGADINRSAPAIHQADVAHLIPRIGQRNHIAALIALVEKHKIDAIIPLIDSDLLALSQAASRFARIGCKVVISKQSAIKTCADKLLTYEALRDANIETPETWSPKQILARKRHRFPYFLKPRSGSAGQGLFKINNADELRVFIKRQPDCVVQEYVAGVEHTMDVYTGFDGIPRCVVPRRRLEVRTGEVSKGLIVKDPKIIDVGRSVAESIKGFRGVVTVQCMVTRAGRISVIEINPRFGGGAPLSIHAGADFPRWMMADLLGKPVKINPDQYTDNIAMLRYDESLFVEGNMKSLLAEVSPKNTDSTEHKT